MVGNTHTRPPRTSLKQRVYFSGAWSFGSYGVSLAISFGSNLFLTRLLAPQMFGVMGMATMVFVGLSLLSDVGLVQSVVRSDRGSDPVFLNTAWVIQILRGMFLGLAALCVSLFILSASRLGFISAQTVYADPSLPYVIAVLSVTLVIGGFQSTKLFEAKRGLSIGRVTITEIIAQIAGLLCMAIWVVFNRSIWTLVAGNVTAALVRTVLSHLWLPGTSNRWQLDKESFREIVHFGRWIVLSSILGFVVLNGDRLLLGSLVDSTVFGRYIIAYLIYISFDMALQRIIVEVAFPALSEVLRERPANLKSSYYRFHSLVALGAYFCSGVLIISGQTIVGLLYDSRYEQSGWMLQILAVALITAPFGIAAQCFMVLGVPKLLSHVAATRLVTLILATIVGFKFFGLSGALWGITASSFSLVPITIFYQIKHRIFDIWRELLLLPLVGVGLGAGMAFNQLVGHLR